MCQNCKLGLIFNKLLTTDSASYTIILMARKTENLIRLPLEVKEKLQILSNTHGVSLSVMVEKLIVEYKIVKD